MARFNHLKNNFLGGEVSAKLFGRSDLEAYPRMCEKILNAIVYPQGGCSMRPGSQFVSSAFSAATKIRIIPYVASPDLKFLIVIRPSTNWIAINASDYSTTTISLSSTQYTVADELDQIQFAQKDLLMVLVHPNHTPIYFSLDRASLPTIAFNPPVLIDAEGVAGLARKANHIPFRDINTTTTTITPSATTGATTLTASAATFNAGHLGSGANGNAYFRVNGGFVEVTGFTSNLIVTGVVRGAALSATTADASWAESSWSDYRGWPRTVAIADQRLTLGGNAYEPDTLWESQQNDYFEFNQYSAASPTVTDAFSTTIASELIDTIQWLKQTKTLTSGTITREHSITGRDSQTAVGRGDIGIRSLTNHGSIHVQAAVSEGAVVFAQRSGDKIREMVFNYEEDNYRANDLNFYADTIFKRAFDERATASRPVIKFLAAQSSPNPVIWAVDNNGGLTGITRNRQFGITAFHHHFLGGDLSGEVPQIEGFAIMPSADNTSDEIWLVVARTINGSTVRYIEKIGREFIGSSLSSTSTSINNHPVFSDSAVLFSGSSVTTVTGLTHLIGQTVCAVADGHYVGTFTVSATGTIELASAASKVIVGLPYSAVIKAVPIDAGSVIGSAQGSPKRIDKIAFRFDRTVGAKFGPDESNLQTISFLPVGFTPSDPIPLFTGVKQLSFDKGYDENLQPVVVQDKPLPMNLVSMVMRGITGEG